MATYAHGLYFSETATDFTPPVVANSGLVVAVGTAPIHLATNPAPPNTPVLCTRFSEFVEQFGWSEDFDNYTLCEVGSSQFSLYTIAPTVIINVLDPKKHYAEKTTELSGVTSASATIDGDIDLDSIEVTSGEYVPPTRLIVDTDYSVTFTPADTTDAENPVPASTVLTILDDTKIEDSEIAVKYENGDGEEVSTAFTLTGTTVNLPTDTVVSSVVVESGGVDTLQNLERGADYKVEYLAGTVTLTVLNASKILDDAVNVNYHEIDPSKVTAADIIGGVNVDTGESTGIEAINGVFARLRIVPGTLIAPKYSLDSRVASALISKAEAVGGQFPAMAVIDLDTEKAKTYQAAAEFKTQSNLSSPYCIVCWPKVKNGDREYFLSTHLAALMTRTDARNNDIPYVSPSNQPLAISSAVLEGGTEIYLTRDQANILNGAGIVTALSWNSWRAWGNRTAAYPSTSDPKDSFIPVRRMFSYITSTFATSFLSRLDQPITKRALESMVFSGQIWLDGLVQQGALIGASLALADNLTTADLMDGIVRFSLKITPPSPMRAIYYTLSYDLDALESLLAAAATA